MMTVGSSRSRSRSSDDGDCSIRERSHLTQRIVRFYRTAAGRLPSDKMSAVLHGGFCFGILDPVSNIVANAISSSIGQPATSATEAESLEGMARRSLDGLVAFLISYFRYLPTDEALRYLRVAKADICTAVRLVESDRCTQAFRVDSGTARTALRCAAMATRHPDPDHLVTATLTIFSCLHEVSEVLSHPGCLSAAAVEGLHRILDEHTPELQVMASGLPDRPQTAASGLPDRPRSLAALSSSQQASLTYSLNRALLDRIHGFYLEALALLPPDRLRRHYHRSLVIAGHCYGPLDPVSNVVLNTVWLEATFPVPEEQQLDLPMISSLALLRIETRSLQGMVAFLRAFAGGDLSDLEAYWFLLYADANLGRAMEALKQARPECDKPKGHRTVPLSDLYQAAVTAALHPRPDMLQEFLTSGRVDAMLPAYSGRLSLQDVRSLIMSLSETKPSTQNGLPLLPAIYQGLPQMPRSSFTSKKEEFQRELTLFSRLVEAALKEYTQHNGGTEYELIFICGGNGSVADDCGPELSSVDWPWSVFKYHYCHANFLARPRGSDVAPTLFFAECVKYDESSDLDRETTCCPVVVTPTHAGEELRCFYCEYEGTSIVHPTERNYHGCDTDIEKMVLGNHIHRTEMVVYRARCKIEYLSILPVDYVYFDPEHSHEHVQTAHVNCE